MCLLKLNNVEQITKWKTKDFKLDKDNLILRIDISEDYIITSWKHLNNNNFTNSRKFNINDKDKAFNTLKYVCNINELNYIQSFIFYSNDNSNSNQLSLF